MVNPDSVQADFSISQSQRFMRGLAIIAKYEADPGLAAAHDIFYFGDYESTVEQMTEDEQRAMYSYNWIESEDSWAFFT